MKVGGGHGNISAGQDARRMCVINMFSLEQYLCPDVVVIADIEPMDCIALPDVLVLAARALERGN